MLKKEWSKLQNGSDIRGIALKGVEGQDINLDSENVARIGAAFIIWLSEKTGIDKKDLKISIGNDSRLSADMMINGVINGIQKQGARACRFGLASTPAMFMSTVTGDEPFHGAIMITASHLPFNRNGLKFFTAEGGLDKKDITDILFFAQEMDIINIEEICGTESIDFMSVYAGILIDKIRKGADNKNNYEKPLEGLRIIVDAGNGAGGFFVDKVLKELGADTEGSQFLEPDGSFPNHIPNPEDKEAMESIKKAVLDNRADFGIIFDTDVDRAGAVDKNGREINRNRIIALMSAIVLSEHPGTTIVTDSITSTGLNTFIEDELKGKHLRYRRGYKNVINKAIELNKKGQETHLAIETSGHGALKENYFLDDGAYIIAKILIEIAKLNKKGKSVDQLIQNLSEPLESIEYRLNINTENFAEYGNKIIEDLKVYAGNNELYKAAPDNYEGIRCSFSKYDYDGWFLLRLSLHDPLMPLNIESNVKGGVKNIADELYKFLKKYKNLNTDVLK
jgi:phosphomannomutase